MTASRSAGTEEPEDPGVLHGRYELRELLGSGSTSRVYLARDRELDRTVAIKMLTGPPAAENVERLRREARSVAAIDHPHVVSVHDIGVTRGAVFVVMEHVRGETLRTVLERRGRLPVDEAVRVSLQVCRALSAAHGAGVVHRDISPANIVLGAEGTAKVLDFGIARGPTGEVAEAGTGHVWGTPAYLSPEQARGESPGACSDIYSLGCCLYRMVTGHAPFESSTPRGVVAAHLHERARPPRDIDPALPEQLQQIILRALAKHPDDRFSGAEELGAELTVLDSRAGTGTLWLPAAERETGPVEPRNGGAVPDERGRIVPGPELDEAVEPDTGASRRWVGLTMMVVGLAVLLVVVVVVAVRVVP